MANILESYFEQTSLRIPSPPLTAEENLPKPDYPEVDVGTPRGSPEDLVMSAGERWKVEVLTDVITGGKRGPFLDDDDRQLIDGGVREAGIDVLAFYKSRREMNADPYPGKWGIFFLYQGVNRIREIIEEAYPGYGPSLKLAYEFLRQHERFHFKFDFYALAAESALGRALYLPLKTAFRHHRIYVVEEALANRDAWEWAKRDGAGIKELAFDFMKLQPGAYARFDERKYDLCSELSANLYELNVSRSARREDQALWIGTIPAELARRSLCPEYFVFPTHLSNWISPAWKLPEVREVKDSESLVKLLSSKYQAQSYHWQATKTKLIKNPHLPGLDFKRWDKKTGVWSVRVSDNFRAHLHQLSNSPGIWEAHDFGPHTKMGHG